MKDQTFGIEIEMNGITRAKAAEVIAAHFDIRPTHVGGSYDTWAVYDNTGDEPILLDWGPQP